jgi:hypothetical protein
MGTMLQARELGVTLAFHVQNSALHIRGERKVQIGQIQAK